MTVATLDAADPQWAAFVEARGASLFHSPAWAAVLAETYGLTVEAYVLVDAGGRPCAGLPVCRIADAVGERIVSLPFSDHCDPLLGDPAHWPPLFDALRAFELPISLLGLHDTVAGADARLATIKRARWHGVDLEDGGAGTLWSRLASSARRAIRKATREGVVVERLDDEHFLREFHRMHVAVRKRKYRMLAQPAAFFAAIRRQFASLEGWLPLAAWHRGRCVAATIFLTWGDTLYYRFNTSEPEALGVRPNDLLLWEGIRLAAARGLRCVDLGRSDDDQPGLIRFKRQFGACEREIRHLRYLPPRYASERDAETRRLLAAATHLLTEPAVPDDVTAAAGTALYRFFA